MVYDDMKYTQLSKVEQSQVVVNTLTVFKTRKSPMWNKITMEMVSDVLMQSNPNCQRNSKGVMIIDGQNTLQNWGELLRKLIQTNFLKIPNDKRTQKTITKRDW
jgi:hypothetical protein